MKNILLTLMVFGIVSCSKEIPFEQLVERNGVNYQINSQTPFSGKAVIYHENGQLKVKIIFKDGKKEGTQEDYFENGQLKWMSNFKNGKEDGLTVRFAEDGQSILVVRCYSEGKIVEMSYCNK